MIRKTPNRPSIRDVAVLANCALGSASKALAGNESVSPAMRDRVLRAAEELGYIPNHHARNLKSGRSQRIGILMPFVSDLYYATIIDAFTERVMDSAFRLDVQFHRWIKAEEERAIQYFIAAGMDGVILSSCSLSFKTTAGCKLLEKAGIPYVLLGGNDKGNVQQDLKAGTSLLTSHLLSLGHRKIALLIPFFDKKSYAVKERIDGAQSVIDQCGDASLEVVLLQNSNGVLPARKEIGACGISTVSYHLYMNNLVEGVLSRKSSITAAIVSNQMTGWHLINALTSRGVSVPEDFSVAAIGLSKTDHYAGFPLTAAEYSADEIALKALDLIFGKVSEQPPLQPILVQRSSVAPVQLETTLTQ